MKEIKIYEIPNIDFIERIDDPYIGMIFYVADIDTYYSVKTLKEINGINMKGSKVVEYVIDEYADFGTGSGGGSGLTATQLANIAKIPAIQSTVDALPNNYASKNHNHSEYASSSHRHDASEIDNLPSGGNGESTTIVDNLNSTSTTSALSANQGRVIKSSLEHITTTKFDDVSIIGTELNLKSNGVIKKTVILPSAGEVAQGHTHINKTILDGITQEKILAWDSNNGTSDELNFKNTNVVNTISATVDESVVGQEYLGGYIEIQPDSWDGVICSTDESTNTWGFPMSLLNSEQARIKKDLLNGDGTGIMYIRFPLGFAYRGYRNIDNTSHLAKNIGERFKGQNARLKILFENIAEAGGGLAPEYWCPPPHWLTSGSYSGADNQLCAGGSYPQNTSLASIKTSDSSQYNAQIQAFTDAVVNDLEYLHQNIAPVRMFGLQNEPALNNTKYGSCKYDATTYNDVLEVLYPKIQSSNILSVYNDEKNEVKLLVASSEEASPFTGIAAPFINAHSNMIWGYTHHSMRKASGEEKVSGIIGADWYKTTDFKNIKGNRKNVFINEYEYFTTSFGTDEFRCSNNMLHLINELVYGEAQVLHPVIHIFKPIGQISAQTNTKGYCLYAVNLKGEYGSDINAKNNTDKLAKGTAIPNKTMYNSWSLFNNNLPIGSYLVGDYSNVADNLGWCTLKHAGKLYIFMANNGETDSSITLTFDSEKTFDGKFYNIDYCGKKIKEKKGTTIEFVVPAYTGQCWIETVTPTQAVDPIPCTKVAINPSTLNFSSFDSQSIQTTVLPEDTTDTVVLSVEPLGIVEISNNTITPIATGEAVISATCGNAEATCNVTVLLPTLQSISAVYTQGSTVIYPNTPLDKLKSSLVVTANYSDGTNQTINDYTIDGTLTEGDSTITVTYKDKTDTFTVNVSATTAIVNSEECFLNNFAETFCEVGEVDGIYQYIEPDSIYYVGNDNRENASITPLNLKPYTTYVLTMDFTGTKYKTVGNWYHGDNVWGGRFTTTEVGGVSVTEFTTNASGQIKPKFTTQPIGGTYKINLSKKVIVNR